MRPLRCISHCALSFFQVIHYKADILIGLKIYLREMKFSLRYVVDNTLLLPMGIKTFGS